MTLDVATALTTLPSGLRQELLDAYAEIVSRYARRDWGPQELEGGRLCEVAYSIVVGYLDGSYPASASKPQNVPQSCWDLASKYPKTASHSARILIPRMVLGLYDIRNNRGVGHVGGDVDPNEMDSTAVLYMSKWIVAEIIRLLHNVHLDEAQALVDQIVEREIPLVWVDGARRRILEPSLKLKQRVLVLLLSVTSASVGDLSTWSEYNDLRYLRRTLREMHAAAWVDFDEATNLVQLLPPGVVEAESIIRSLRP